MKKSESLPYLFCHEQREPVAHGRFFYKKQWEQFAHSHSFVKRDKRNLLPSLFKKEQLSKELLERSGHKKGGKE